MLDGTTAMRTAARILFLFLVALGWQLVEASHITINGPPPQLHLAVGSLGTTVDTVAFNVPSGSEGSGVPIAGDQPIVIEVATRRGGGSGGGPTNVLLTVNSSAPLTSGPNTIPLTEISWTSANGIISSGNFNGTSNQLLLGFFAPNGTTRREDTLSFFYANSTVPVAGTYSGTVIYTATAL
jgi:hypothetical protein